MSFSLSALRMLPSAPRVKWSNPLTRGLVGYWPLSDGGGLTARDIAGGNHATATKQSAVATGEFGSARDFGSGGVDWTKQFRNSSGPALGVSASFTVSCWVKSFGYPGSGQIGVVVIRPDLSNLNAVLFVDRFLSNTVRFEALSVAVHVSVLTVQKWIFVVGTVLQPDALLALYFNGRFAGSIGGASSATDLYGVSIGGWISNIGFNGQISNVSIFNRALTPPEIQRLYNQPLCMIDNSVEVWSPAPRAAVAPTITTQPISQTADQDTDVTLSVVAEGDPVLTYQWYKDDAPIAGETLDSLTLVAVDNTDDGEYFVIVTNAVDSVASDKATITVTSKPPVLGAWAFPGRRPREIQQHGTVQIQAVIAGRCTVDARLTGHARLTAQCAGGSTAQATLRGRAHLVATAAGRSRAEARLDAYVTPDPEQELALLMKLLE